MKLKMNGKSEVGNPAFNMLVILFGLFLTTQKKYFTYYKTIALFWLIGTVIVVIFLVQGNGYFIIMLVIILIGFLKLTDNQLWKYRPFSHMFTVDDFSGTYKGTIESFYFKEFKQSFYSHEMFREYKRNSKLTIIVYQTGSEIKVSFFYVESGDKKIKAESSKVMMTKTDDGQHIILTCHYGELGTIENGGHHVTVVLKFIRKENDHHVKGGFYDNRKLQARGKFVDLKKVNQNTLHPF
ncbi:hypothetical protein KORDIASMS9_00190 [Kordia sp. SMS9]|uniref:hypothetical protein n=1 Tax=Kordia sp. SMS9 TaxID=2282170 RepID=UPI000E104791|nr:hypothetical protein [Kordia sp. SMS9]AXG68006.1 hypothetical protein KORDIASMS9_00190 [Kordia sp. SMS9]